MKRILAAVVLTAAALTAASCGSSTPTASPSQRPLPSLSPNPSGEQPNPSASTASPSPTGPAFAAWGERNGVSITSGNGGDATVAALSETSTTLPADSEFGSRPSHGYFLVIRVRVEDLPSATGSFDISSLDFYVRVRGEHFDEGNGNSYDAVSDTSDELSAVTLNPGERTNGLLLFDVPSPHGQLVYAPNYTGESLVEWKF